VYAGVPPLVVVRAREILKRLERGEAVAPRVAGEESVAAGRGKARKRASILPQAQPWEDHQLGLFDNPAPHPAVERLKKTDPNRLTPLEALAVLAELKRIAEDG
jgi:DNA mismatch repair protein MutS